MHAVLANASTRVLFSLTRFVVVLLLFWAISPVDSSFKGLLLSPRMSIPDTFGSEIPDSSPQASIIDIATDAQHDLNDIYSLDRVDTPRLHTQLQRSHVIDLSSEDNIKPTYDEEIDQSSGLFEVSQKDFINSQKQRLRATQDPIIPSSSQQEYYDLRSGQSPVPSLIPSPVQSPDKYAPITSSPMHPSPTQDSLPPLIHKITNSMAPSAQLTSFRMQSPTKINSTKTTPKKRNILISRDSYTLPHLLSPSKSSLINPLTPIHGAEDSPSSTSSSPSIYCTARQNVNDVTSPRYEIKTSAVKFKGRVSLEHSSPFNDYQTRVIPLKRSTVLEEILDSSEDEDESEISIIEITRTVKKPKLSTPSKEVVLQVPSSQGLASSPLKPQTPPRFTEWQEEQVEDDEFMAMSMDEIKKKIMQYGIKPTKSKLSMINSLKQVTQFLSQESLLKLSLSQNINNSQNIVKKDVFEAMSKAVSKDSNLMEKIYTFEPTSSADLVKCLNDNGINVSTEMFKDWCDHNSICLTED